MIPSYSMVKVLNKKNQNVKTQSFSKHTTEDMIMIRLSNQLSGTNLTQ